MLNEELHKALSKFARDVVKQSKRNLKSKKSTGKLSRSLDYDIKVSKNSFSLDFLMEAYGSFIDKGVSGKNKKYNTPFKYKNKRPPSSKFDKWTIRKGIAPRDSEGKFINRKSLNYLIARSIYYNGIKPSLFFTKPFEKAFKNLPDDLIKAYGLEVDEFLDHTLNELFKDANL